MYTNAVKIDIEEWKKEMHFWSTNETDELDDPTPEIVQSAGIRLLERMNEETGCFILYTAEETAEYRELVVFLIDGDYYFMDITNGVYVICCTKRDVENK